MIPLAEINAAAIKFGVPAETIEKDYIISWVLYCLSKSKLKNNFIFYGGTAIKRVYFEDHRFSEDIDLISNARFTQDYIVNELDQLQYAYAEANLPLEIDKNNILANKDRIQIFIRYSGYNEIMMSPKEIRIDFSMDMSHYGETREEAIIPSYSDLKNQTASLRVMTLNTILANKLGLLMDSTRNEPRDLFDIWFILQRIKKFDFNPKKICKAFYEKYGFQPTLTLLGPRLNNASYKNNWNIRLKKQLPELPDIELIIKEIKEKLKKLKF